MKKNEYINYCETVYEGNGKNLFWSSKQYGGILNKSKKGFHTHLLFLASSVSTYAFSTPCTTLPHKLIKEKILNKSNTLLTERAHYIWLVMRHALFYF